MHEATFEWRGRTVWWTRRGSGPPVVFCHGTPWSSALWAPFMQALERDYTTYAWDMPGYGRSSKHPQHSVDLGTQSELFADLLQAWGLRNAHVVAHDFGGVVSLRAHLLHGSDFASLLLADVVALSPWGSPFFQLVKEHADVFMQLPPHVHRGALESYISTASARGLDESALQMLTAPWLTDEGRPAFYRQIAEADERFTDEIRGRLVDVRAPTRIVWGREDSWIPADRAGELHRLVPGSSLRLLEDAGHLVQLDAPAAVADEVRSWLDHQPKVGAEQ